MAVTKIIKRKIIQIMRGFHSKYMIRMVTNLIRF